MSTSLQSFLHQIRSAIDKDEFIKLSLGNKRNRDAEVKNVFVKIVAIKNNLKLSFLYRYPTKDITKNFEIEEGLTLIEALLKKDFFNADLFTTVNDQ